MYKSKKTLLKISSAVLAVLVTACAAILIYISSPLYPGSIDDETVIEKGEEYKVKLIGISEYNEEGFLIASDSFYFLGKETYLYVDENGFARTSYDKTDKKYRLYGKFNSAFISYDEFDFCGERFKSVEELEAFFKEPDPIYNFDIDKLSEYISEIIQYERKFHGQVTIKFYRGRCVITDMYIGSEKVLERKSA